MKRQIYIVFGFLIVLLVQCNDVVTTSGSVGEEKKTNSPLFTVLPPTLTHLNFVNVINESPTVNGVLYEYLYNGGGVAAGDFDSDGLPDLYFISNLYSNKYFANKGNLVFEDQTSASGLKGKVGFPTGVTTVDINADGLLDIYISKSGNYPNPEYRKNELYVNLGTNDKGVPVFEEMAKKYGLDLPHYSTQAAFFDYDKDGDLDMFLLNHGIDPAETEPNIDALLIQKSKYSSNKLFQNDKGKFIDVSDDSGIINNAIGYGLGIAIGDLNNDGWPDMVVGMDYSEKDHLYLNQKNGRFKEVVREATNHISNFSMGNDIGDINNDGRFDFISVDMVSNTNYDLKTNMSGMNPKRFHDLIDKGLHRQYMFNTLQLNNGTPPEGSVPAFSDVAQMTGVSKTNWSWAPLFFDMDNDGRQDLFVSNGVLRSFRNNDFVSYKRQRVDELYRDMKKYRNRDSLIENYYKDLLAVMPEKKEVNLFYRNNGDLSFSEVNEADPANKPTATNGAIYVDLDNDGDLDVVGNNINDAAIIYKNNTSETTSKNFLKIRLKGDQKNSYGIGAKVILNSGAGEQAKELYVSRGFQSAIANQLHFGLGKGNLVEQLTVEWPDGKSQILKDIGVDQLLVLNQNEASESRTIPSDEKKLIFQEAVVQHANLFRHNENSFDDFERELLLPHKYSQSGPALAVGDVNNDGLDDFFIGGAKNQMAELFLQKQDGSFHPTKNKVWAADSMHEDISAEFFDADNDGDLDMFVVSGGNELAENDPYYRHRFYENLGEGKFAKNKTAIPDIRVSGSCVKKGDFDNDGDMDLFVGGKVVPGKYPNAANSYLLRNESKGGKIAFTDVTQNSAPFLTDFGMVSDAVWADIDNDKDLDLIIVGEWMPIRILRNSNGTFTENTEKSGLENRTGWWYSIAAQDFDADGDIDFIVGNLGKNYKYKASQEEPFEVYADDFDQNGSLDIVLSYHEEGKLYPLRGRECSSDQMPFIKSKFPSYNDYGAADLSTVYGAEALQKALHYKATSFASVYVENLGNFSFKIHELDALAQLSSVNSILIDDFNADGNSDALLSGNLYQSEVETPRNDASFGTLLLGNGKGQFKSLYPYESGLYVRGDVKQARIVNAAIKGKKQLLFAKNDDALQFAVYGSKGGAQIEL